MSVTYVLNIIFQAFFTLLTPAGLGFLISYLLIRFAGAPDWLYAPLLTVGILIGFVSMIKFILSTMKALERLEAERSQAKLEKAEAKDRRDALHKNMASLSEEIKGDFKAAGADNDPSEGT